MFKRSEVKVVLSALIYLFFFIIMLVPNFGYAQQIYYVSSQGDDSKPGNSESTAWRTIAKVSSMSFNSGDIVSFKSGQKFNDAVLNCKQGVTYNTYGGSEKAIIGDNLRNTSSDATIQINYEYVTLSNIKIYGYSNSNRVIIAGRGHLNIEDCEIVGGENAHADRTIGIDIPTDAGHDLSFQRNKIHSLGFGIRFGHPYNVDIGYNELYDFWIIGGRRDYGGSPFIYTTTYNSQTEDTWDCAYTYRVHNNDIYDFEYTAGGGGGSRVIWEYNNIHNNLDERIYRGGVKHGSIGKMFDDTGMLIGNVGLIFRYNYVHDLIRRGEANYTYGEPTQWNIDNGVPNTVNTNNGLGKAVYLGAGLDPTTDPNYGDDVGESPDNVISGGGYDNYWVHNNIFYNCSNNIIGRSIPVGSSAKIWNDALGSYFINNTVINCGFCDYITTDNGLFITEYQANSPHTMFNNIIDFTNPDARYAGRWKSKVLYLDDNIYLKQSGSTDKLVDPGDQKAAFFESGTEQTGHSHEQYLTDPNCVNPYGTTFDPLIGPNGVNISDVRIQKDGHAYNTGKPYNTIGDTYADSYGIHQLGKDPTSRSFAYDILGNLRTTNDIGAVGVASNINSSADLKVFLEASYVGNSEMNTKLSTSSLLPLIQPYNVNPWNINDNSRITNPSKNYVDWILVQLRDDLTRTKYSKPALLNKDGGVVNPDGSPFSFSNISEGQYYIVIRHRNHISIMSSAKVQINNNEEVKYDFTDSQNKAYGTNSMADLGNGKYGMIAGDENADGKINDLDFTTVAEKLFSGGYIQGDVDMNGVVNVLDYYFINKNMSRSINSNIDISYLIQSSSLNKNK